MADSRPADDIFALDMIISTRKRYMAATYLTLFSDTMCDIVREVVMAAILFKREAYGITNKARHKRLSP